MGPSGIAESHGRDIDIHLRAHLCFIFVTDKHVIKKRKYGTLRQQTKPTKQTSQCLLSPFWSGLQKTARFSTHGLLCRDCPVPSHPAVPFGHCLLYCPAQAWCFHGQLLHNFHRHIPSMKEIKSHKTILGLPRDPGKHQPRHILKSMLTLNTFLILPSGWVY